MLTQTSFLFSCDRKRDLGCNIFHKSIRVVLSVHPHTTPFSNENGTVLFRIRLPISENGSIRKRSPEWNDLKTVLFESAVFLLWTAKTTLSESDDVTTTTRPGCRPLNHEYPRWRTDAFRWLPCWSLWFLSFDALGSVFNPVETFWFFKKSTRHYKAS